MRSHLLQERNHGQDLVVGEPYINKNPIGLSNNEILSVIAFLQQMSGESITVSPSEIVQPVKTAAVMQVAHAR